MEEGLYISFVKPLLSCTGPLNALMKDNSAEGIISALWHDTSLSLLFYGGILGHVMADKLKSLYSVCLTSEGNAV